MDNENIKNQDSTERTSEPGRFDCQPEENREWIPPQQMEPMPGPKVKKRYMGLSIASLTLSTISVVGCWFYGLSIVPALIGTIMGVFVLIRGKDRSVRIMGIVGMVLGILGIVLNVMVLIAFGMIINWDQINYENIQSIQNIEDPQNNDEILRWMQQFFKIDISKYYYGRIN